MKRILKISVLALLVVLGSSLQNRTSAQSYDDYDGDVSYQTFYDELSPHGRWIDYPEYGYVWSPYEGPDFRPYSTRGHWVWSDEYDWMWVSDYDWGWAPFHYGRWFNDPHYGWLWVPGYEWSPAWVAWRQGGDYYGWAPIRPGIHISINFSLGNYYAPDLYWSFAPRRYITSRNIYNHCIDWRRNVTVIHHTTIINNYNYGRNVWRTGPHRYDAERYSGRIDPVRFRASNRPGRSEFRNNEVSIYRPRVQSENRERFSPRKFERADRSRVSIDGNSAGSERRIETNDGRIERNNNDFRRNENREERNNNLPNRQGDTRIERRDNTTPRQPVENRNNPANDTRRFERRDENNPATNDNRVRPRERPVIEPQNNGNNNNQRRFERKEKENTRPADRPIIRPAERNNPGNGNNEFRRERNTTQPPTRQPEVNTERRQNTPVRPQVQSNTEQRQEQPRQFERRNNNSSEQGKKEENKNNGRKRF